MQDEMKALITAFLINAEEIKIKFLRNSEKAYFQLSKGWSWKVKNRAASVSVSNRGLRTVTFLQATLSIPRLPGSIPRGGGLIMCSVYIVPDNGNNMVSP